MYDTQVRHNAAYIAKKAVSYINATGMVIGIIATNVSDVLFGGIMLSLLLKDIDILFGAPYDGWLAGFVVSFAFWFIQILMWQMIFEDDVVSPKDAIPLVLAIAVAVVDTNIDVAPLFMWMNASAVAATLKEITLFGGLTLYDIVQTSTLVGFYIVNGCSELFNAWYIGKNTNVNFSMPKIKRNKSKQQERVRSLADSAREATARARRQNTYPPVSNR